MAEIRKFLMFRHLRAESSSFVMHHRGGKLVRSGRGLTFWFLPLSSSVAELPADDRELTLLFHGRTADFQEITVQGVLTYRVSAPEVLAERVDFGLDLSTGRHRDEPFERLGLSLSQLAAQLAYGVVARSPVRALLETGCERLRDGIEAGLRADGSLAEMGVEVVSVRVGSVKPTPDLERALEAPTREQIQQDADQAAFHRRAMAVEKERAIAENELHNRIELAKKEEQLITQRGQNTRREKTEEAEAARIEAESSAAQGRVKAEARAHELGVTSQAQAEAERIREAVRIEAERKRMEIQRELPPELLYGLAARELAGKLQKIEHLNVAPELLGPLLGNLVRAGTRKLAADEATG